MASKGAGVIPFSVIDGEVHFLLHKTFIGKKKGYWIDFGGAFNESDVNYPFDTAAREFVEETCGFFGVEEGNDEWKSGGETEASIQSCPLTHRLSLSLTRILISSMKNKEEYLNISKSLKGEDEEQEKEEWNGSELVPENLWSISSEGYTAFYIPVLFKSLEPLNEFYEKVEKKREFSWISSKVFHKTFMGEETGTLPLYPRITFFPNIKELIERITKHNKENVN